MASRLGLVTHGVLAAGVPLSLRHPAVALAADHTQRHTGAGFPSMGGVEFRGAGGGEEQHVADATSSHRARSRRRIAEPMDILDGPTRRISVRCAAQGPANPQETGQATGFFN